MTDRMNLEERVRIMSKRKLDYLGVSAFCESMAMMVQAGIQTDEAIALLQSGRELSGGVLEQGITCLNMANAVEAQEGMEAGEHRIYELVDRAWELLDDPSVPRDGYYAFVCEKCAPTFSYYGYFAAAEELNERAKQIYERT